MKVTLIQRESTEWKVDMSQPVYFADSSGECITDVICCDYCENWFHYKCKKKYIEKPSLKLEARKTHFVTLSVQEVLNSCLKYLRLPKESVHFVLDHSSIISKKSNSNRMEHWDNCSVWETTSTSLKTTFFVREENGTLKFCEKKKDGKFYREDRKKEYTFGPSAERKQLS